MWEQRKVFPRKRTNKPESSGEGCFRGCSVCEWVEDDVSGQEAYEDVHQDQGHWVSSSCEHNNDHWAPGHQPFFKGNVHHWGKAVWTYIYGKMLPSLNEGLAWLCPSLEVEKALVKCVGCLRHCSRSLSALEQMIFLLQSGSPFPHATADLAVDRHVSNKSPASLGARCNGKKLSGQF